MVHAYRQRINANTQYDLHNITYITQIPGMPGAHSSGVCVAPAGMTERSHLCSWLIYDKYLL